MSREYVITGANITVAGASSLIMIMPGTTAAIEITRMWVGQNGTATSAQVRLQAFRQAAALPTTAVSATPAKLKEGDPTSLIAGATTIAAGKCGINIGTEGAGTKTPIFDDAMNNLSGWLWAPKASETIVCSPSSASAFGLWFPAAPGTLTGWHFGMVFRELS